MALIKTAWRQERKTGRRLVYRSTNNPRFFMRVSVSNGHGPYRFVVDFTENILEAQLMHSISHQKHIRDFTAANPGEWVDAYITVKVPE